jgi:tRNA (adenine37-N6)-methyltransferase
MSFQLRAIGVVRGGRSQPFDDEWGSVRAAIDLDAGLVPVDATRGLEDFSHLEVVYGFHLVEEPTAVTGSRHPRGRTDWPLVGGLAQRNKQRVNRLGVSRCRLLAVDGHHLEVQALDAVDGSPVFDVKPWMEEFGPDQPTAQPSWATELMTHYYATGAADPRP